MLECLQCGECGSEHVAKIAYVDERDILCVKNKTCGRKFLFTCGYTEGF